MACLLSARHFAFCFALVGLGARVGRGSAAVQNRANVYAVKLVRHAPSVRYLIVADIRGTSSHGRPPDRRGCNGVVWIQGELPPDWRSKIQQTAPSTGE